MKYQITSRFHQQESFRAAPHNGIDLKMEIGEPLRSIKSGIIHLRDYGTENAGKTILIDGEDGKTYIYGHLSSFNVKEGQSVSEGDLIGFSGNTGHSTGAHLHFGIKEGERFIDPSPYTDLLEKMNDSERLTTIIPKEEVASQTHSFLEVLNSHTDIYSNFFQSLKLQMISLFNLIDYSMLVQHFQNLLQFFSW